MVNVAWLFVFTVASALTDETSLLQLQRAQEKQGEELDCFRKPGGCGFHKKKKNKPKKKVQCAVGWDQQGSWDTENDIVGGNKVQMAKSSNKCAKKCKGDKTCKSYTFAQEGRQKTCLLHMSNQHMGSKGSNQVLCIKPSASTTVAPTTPSPAPTTVAPTTPLPAREYNCYTKEVWTQDKKDWCCMNKDAPWARTRHCQPKPDLCADWKWPPSPQKFCASAKECQDGEECKGCTSGHCQCDPATGQAGMCTMDCRATCQLPTAPAPAPAIGAARVASPPRVSDDHRPTRPPSLPPRASEVLPGEELEVERKTCTLKGDPHIETFDSDGGRNKNFYNYGDYWIVKSEEPGKVKDGLVYIQGRYWSSRPDGQSAIRSLAIGDPNNLENKIIIEPKNYGGITFNGEPADEAFTSDWCDHTIGNPETGGGEGKKKVRLVQKRKPGKRRRKARKGKKARKGRAQGINHVFSIKGREGEEWEEVLIEVGQFNENLNLVITMPKWGTFAGHCGNFNGDPDDEEDQPEWNAMVDAKDLMFEPKVWDVVKPEGIECGQDTRIWNQANLFCKAQQQEEVLHDPQSAGEHDSELAEQSAVDACIVDYCNSGAEVAESGLQTDRVRKNRNKKKNKVSCAACWVQPVGSSWDKDNDIDDDEPTQIAKSSNQCANKCERKQSCTSYTFARENKLKTCVLHESAEKTRSKGSNQVLCIHGPKWPCNKKKSSPRMPRERHVQRNERSKPKKRQRQQRPARKDKKKSRQQNKGNGGKTKGENKKKGRQQRDGRKDKENP